GAGLSERTWRKTSEETSLENRQSRWIRFRSSEDPRVVRWTSRAENTTPHLLEEGARRGHPWKIVVWRTKSFKWRREWDSNPRYGFPHTRFPSVRLKPLGRLSGWPVLKGPGDFCKRARRSTAVFPQPIE